MPLSFNSIIRLEQPVTGIVHTIILSLYRIEIRVEYGGTTWDAVFHDASDQRALKPGQRVNIVSREGNTLLIATPQAG